MPKFKPFLVLLSSFMGLITPVALATQPVEAVDQLISQRKYLSALDAIETRDSKNENAELFLT
mgnify:FL=1